MPKILSTEKPTPTLPDGWHCVTSIRRGGKSIGKRDNHYFSPAFVHRFRSRRAVIAHLAKEALPPISLVVPVAPTVVPVAVPVDVPLAVSVPVTVQPAPVAVAAASPVVVPIFSQVEIDSQGNEVVIVYDSSDEEVFVYNSSSDEDNASENGVWL